MSEWTQVCAVGEISAGNWKVVDIDGAIIAVFLVAGEYYAIEDICTHDGGELTGGEVQGCEVICPRHGARFCIKTGAALTPPAYEAVDTFPVLVKDNAVWVRDDRWD